MDKATARLMRVDVCVDGVQLHKPLHFSTGPFSKYTHWKQTVFYLQEDLTICAGEEVGTQPSSVRYIHARCQVSAPCLAKQVVFAHEFVPRLVQIRGVLTCAPNERNPRDLDIDIKIDFEGQRSAVHFSQEFKLR
jgi:protein arginine N-methyltransferase 1